MFEAYCDESGQPSDKGEDAVVTVAAVVSDEQGWCTFEEQWARTLQQYGVSTFHMKEYTACQGEFKTWKHHEKRHRLLMADLSKIFTDTLRFACVVSVALKDWNEAMQRVTFTDHRLKTIGPWLPLFLTCAESMWRTSLIPDQQKIAFWFERNDLLKAPALDHFDKWKTTHGFEGRLGPLAFLEKSDHVALQAADLLAWEGRKYHQNQRFEGGKRNERKSHKALLGSRIVDERMFTQQGLQAYLLENHSRNGAAPPSASQGEPNAEPRSHGFGRGTAKRPT